MFARKLSRIAGLVFAVALAIGGASVAWGADEQPRHGPTKVVDKPAPAETHQPPSDGAGNEQNVSPNGYDWN